VGVKLGFSVAVVEQRYKIFRRAGRRGCCAVGSGEREKEKQQVAETLI